MMRLAGFRNVSRVVGNRTLSVANTTIYRSCQTEREADQADVVVVGGGPSGLSAAIRLKQTHPDLRVIVVEKASEVGAHILSGCVFEPTALDELIPDWKDRGAPVTTKVTSDSLLYLHDKERSFDIKYHPSYLNNEKNYVISLSKLVRWLGEQAEELGVEIFPAVAASEVLYNEDGSVKGIATNDLGVAKDGSHKDDYMPGMELHAMCTVFAEGCRGSLARDVIDKFNLRENCQHQTYGIGIKEVWKLDESKHELGKILHTVGYPLDHYTYGGGFLYHFEEQQMSIGMVIGLDYTNPYLNPYKEFQRWKHHPAISSVFENAECIQYGARALSEGGYQSIPKLYFPGGALIGDSGGFLNVPKIKGTHTAMKSGILCADAITDKLMGASSFKETITVDNFETKFQNSWLHDELYQIRNFRPSFRFGLIPGIILGGFQSFILNGNVPFTLKHHRKDDESLKPAAECTKIEYPKPDGKISFDLLTNLSRSNTNHEEDQPCHLTLVDKNIPTEVNLPIYDGPESRFCPAGVYQYLTDENGKPRLQINQSNCIHCKTCDIKDKNINWVTPEGGGGPIYDRM